MATFGSATFDEAGAEGFWFTRPALDASASQDYFPGGDNYIIKDFGARTPPMILRIQITDAELDDLINEHRQRKTLSWSGGSVTAFLKRIGDPVRAADTDLNRVELEFLL